MSSFAVFLTLTFLVSVNCVSDYRITITKDDYWWGPDELRYKIDDEVRPFRIEFDDEMIQDLKIRLNYHRPSKPTFPDVGFAYGFHTKEVPKWTHYWANVYPFKEREEFLNQMPQYKTYIQGLGIHFIWIRPEVPPGVEVVPLLLLHGWPGSVREFYEVIPHLTKECHCRDYAFELVVPSLPGFGYSDAAARPGLSTQNMTNIFKNLMHRLGHDRFYIQGGDWGSSIGGHISTIYPEVVLGFHTNLAFSSTLEAFQMILLGSFNPSLVVKPELAERLYPLSEKLFGLLQETGYFHLLATKPETIGIGLSDSPTGLLAFLLQAIASGTNVSAVYKEDGGLSLYKPETLMDNLMFYWATNSITTSFRVYTESTSKLLTTLVPSMPSYVPTWAIQARYELVYQPPGIIKTKYKNLLYTTVLEDGGHFLALEKPKVLAEDLMKAIEAFRRWHKTNGQFYKYL